MTFETLPASAAGSKRTLTGASAPAGSGTGGPQLTQTVSASRHSEAFTFTHRARGVFGFAQMRGAANVLRVSPEDLKQLRKELACTAKELATTLGIEPKEMAAWEAGELFPTKRHVGELEALRKKGPSSILRTPKGKAAAAKVGMWMPRLAKPKYSKKICTRKGVLRTDSI